MGDRVSGDVVVAGNTKPHALVTGQLQDYKREPELKDDLQRDQASKRVVIALLGGRKKSRDQGNGNEPGAACPGPCEDGKADCPVNPQDSMHPAADRCKPGCVRWSLCYLGQ